MDTNKSIPLETENEAVATEPFAEENGRLVETFAEIERQRASIGPVYYGHDFVEQVLESRREETRQRLKVLANEPYFGRLDFAEHGEVNTAGPKVSAGKAGTTGSAGSAEKANATSSAGSADANQAPVPLYIGKRGLDRRDSGEPHIIDWRAPVASLFYSFTGGDEPVTYEAPEGVISGEVFRKRSLSIRDKELQRVVESYVRGGDNLGLSDEFLLYRLGERKDNRLRDIVSTIQSEQDRIIRAPRELALIIQGAAGSGKTTVALHRLAYLLYRHQGQMRAERMIIFAPNAMFLDYISGVLPELGVGDVKQTTFTDWALDRLGGTLQLEAKADERWFGLPEKRPPDATLTGARFKGSERFRLWLDEKLQAYERIWLSVEAFEPWDRRILQPAQIREWSEVDYRHYPLYARRERLAARVGRWLEMQLGEIGDPKVRKERGKTAKSKLRTWLKKLPEADEMRFYRGLFEEAAVAEDGFVPTDVAKSTAQYLKRGIVRLEDLAPLLWIRRHFRGAEGAAFDHVVVDEAQDASPFQIALLNAFMAEPSFTVLGDLAQGIHAYRGVHRWEEMTALFEEDRSSRHDLKMSYRSTLEIIEFANRLLPFTNTELSPAEPVFRSGEQVRIIQVSSAKERLAFAEEFVRQQKAAGMRTIALIGRTEVDCAALLAELMPVGVHSRADDAQPAGGSADGGMDDVQAGGGSADGDVAAYHLIAEGQSRYQGGVSIVPAHLAKGLEFDSVLVLDVDARTYPASAHDAKLLYVACTRALHRLALLHECEASPLIVGGG